MISPIILEARAQAERRRKAAKARALGTLCVLAVVLFLIFLAAL